MSMFRNRERGTVGAELSATDAGVECERKLNELEADFHDVNRALLRSIVATSLDTFRQYGEQIDDAELVDVLRNALAAMQPLAGEDD